MSLTSNGAIRLILVFLGFFQHGNYARTEP